MKVFDKKTIIAIFITFILLIFFITYDKSYALSLNIPKISSFVPEENENGALRINFENTNSNNSNFSYEIVNTTTGKINIISGSSKFYVYQNLDVGKKYEVTVRACQNEKYDCSSYTSLVSAIPNGENSNQSNTSNSTSSASASTNTNTAGTATAKSGTIKDNKTTTSTSNASTYNAKKVKSMKKYKNIKVLKTYNKKNMKKLTKVRIAASNMPQSFCDNGKYYIVQFQKVNGSTGRLAAYNKNGKLVKKGPKFNTGHANGLTCDSTLSKIYAVSSGSSASATVLNKTSLKKEKKIKLPTGARAIAYDSSTKQFYVSKNSYIYVLNKNLKKVKSIKMKRANHSPQDIGAYHGLILHAITINRHGNNVIDIYRASDGAYVGTFKVPINELESVVVDNGYLVLLINVVGTANDLIYKSTTKVPLP